ncbi:hypothetical protein B1759_09120 [Rubrivirga sp. SAORIC476]|uniref:hypothetical protein n=1 Tax=Rubrivirga sp. SAORIC476 TaxID=1961794 RepID=UPI000BA9A189|nr:hypothetical protein [Rubrivirga sp. SAORIC476]PAP81470.1 hypothetical protein B1759_09120 [Rubrivirga sp. SAORIC476]
MRLVLCLAALLLAPSAAAQGVMVDYGIGEAGNLADLTNPFTGDDGASHGRHESISLLLGVPMDSGTAGIRIDYTRVTDDSTGDVQQFPGLFLYAVGAPRDGKNLDLVFMGDIGYGMYNREALTWLAWLPTVGVGVGPAVNVGPIQGTVLLGGQLTSIGQGLAIYLRGVVTVR